ncbi:hypothetical protein T484DRAFT_1794774 [Baffinella frigidus]|nr:hypothetical protein T484DRAFT_1794774 [Cryptophyta sp. CCMP2293]
MAASVPTSDAMPGPTVGRRRRSSVHLSDIGGESPTRGVTNARRGSLVHRSTDGDLRRAPGMEGSSSSQESNLECMKTFAFMSERQEGQLAHAPDWRAQRRESLEGGGPVAAAAGNGSPLSLQNSRRNSGVGRELERNDNSSLGYQRRGSVGAGLAAGAGGESFVRGRRGSLIYADASLSPPLRGSPISPERSPESRRNALQGAAGKVIAVGGAVRLLHEGREKGGRLEKKQTFRRMSQDSGDTSREPSASHGPNTEQSPARSESPARSKSPARSESPNRKTRSSKTLRVAGETMVAAGRLARAPKEGMGHLQQDTGNVARTFGGMVGGMAGGNVDFNAKSIDQRRAELHEKVAARRVKGESRGRRGSVDQ